MCVFLCHSLKYYELCHAFSQHRLSTPVSFSRLKAGKGIFGVIITLSILAFLDRNGIGTVQLHLSTFVNVSLIPFRSDPRPSILRGSFRNKLYWYSLVRSVCDADRWSGTVPEQVWTHAVAYRSKLYRNSFYRYSTAIDVDRVNMSY